MYRRNKRPFGSILPARNQYEGLRVSITYYKTRYTFSTGLEDNPHHRAGIRKMLDGIYSHIQEGTFRFAEVFKNADPEKKKYFSRLEGQQYRPRADEVTIREYVAEWLEEWLDNFKELTKTPDYESAIKRILAGLGGLHFAQLNTIEVERFFGSLDILRGARKGQPVSVKRKRHVLTVLKRIWNSANSRWGWQLDDPFVSVSQYITELEQVNQIRQAKQTPLTELLSEDGDAEPRKAFLPSEWQMLLAHIEPFYGPVTEFMLLTMAIGSEIEALTKQAVGTDKVRIQLKRHKDGTISPYLKTTMRKRNYPITAKLRQVLDAALRQSSDECAFVFTMADGSPFSYAEYYKYVWGPAVKAAGLDHRVGYSTRHTGIAWSMLLKVDHERLTGLTGHADKGMIYRQYGKYRDGLYEERELILDYMGRDYLLEGEFQAFLAAGPLADSEPAEQAGKKIAVVPTEIFSDNFGDKQRLFADNYTK